MNLKKSAKGRLIPVVILCIVIASTGFLCFFHDPSQKGQYCNHILHWKKCDGQLVRIFGKVPAFVMQHPSYLSDNHNIKRQHQSYIDTAFRKQIVLLSEERRFSFKTSGLFLMYDTFPRRRNEFKRETEKF
jgi:hypothetical protein